VAQERPRSVQLKIREAQELPERGKRKRVIKRKWPRTKRNVVEGKMLLKMGDRAVLGFPKDPQYPKQ
jgi:hypothetical protein